MTISIDRSQCCDLNETIAREWLVTNGLGGYAAGTVAGVLTRTQHGLLVAMPPHADAPQLLLAKIDEEIIFDQRTYYLGTNEYRDGTWNPAGFVHLEAFRLEEGFPVFTYRLGGIDGLLLEKRIWMNQSYNTTYIQYRALRTTTTESQGYRRSGLTGAVGKIHSSRMTRTLQEEQHLITLTLLPFAASRQFNQLQHGSNSQHYQVQIHRSIDDPGEGSSPAALLPRGVAGCAIQANENSLSYHLLAVGEPENQPAFIPTGVWYWNFLHRQDTTSVQSPTDDLYLPGVIRATLDTRHNAPLTIVISAEPLSTLPLHPQQIAQSLQAAVTERQRLVDQAREPQRYFGDGGEAAHAYHLTGLPLPSSSHPQKDGEEYLRILLQATDHFLVRIPHPSQQRSSQPLIGTLTSDYPGSLNRHEQSTTLLADYYSLENRTRDMLIALPGLTLVTERYDVAHNILRELAGSFIGGLLPQRLPREKQPLEDQDYENVDITLWYFYALDQYLRVTHHYEFLEEIFHTLRECINRYIQGTYHGIRVDPTDGLLIAHKPGKALTWMNTSIHGIPVTPRSGKPVEVNALWYYTLSLMHEWSQHLAQMGHFSYDTVRYQHLLTQCKQSFQQRFWYAAGGYLYDVIDGPAGDDSTLRPNQLFALSLRYPVLDTPHRQQVMEVVSRHLLTPYGLRTLAPIDAQYKADRGEDLVPEKTTARIHQGSVLPWLIGPYIDALLTSQSQSLQEHLWRRGQHLLEPFRQRLEHGLLGMCEGVLEAESPFSMVRGTPCASALSTAELLRCYARLAQLRHHKPEHALSY